MASKEEKEYKAAQVAAAQQGLAGARDRAARTARGALSTPKLRAAGDTSRYLIGGYMDDPTGNAGRKPGTVNPGTNTSRTPNQSKSTPVIGTPTPPPRIQRQPAPARSTRRGATPNITPVPTGRGDVRQYRQPNGVVQTVIDSGSGSRRRAGGPTMVNPPNAPKPTVRKVTTKSGQKVTLVGGRKRAGGSTASRTTAMKGSGGTKGHRRAGGKTTIRKAATPKPTVKRSVASSTRRIAS